MSCLFIYTDERKREDFSNFMAEVFPETRWTPLNTTDCALDKVMQLLEEVTMCVISPGERTQLVSFLVGYILGKGAPIYTSKKEFSDSHKPLKLIYNFKTVSSLYDHLRRHKKDIQLKELQRTALSTLMKLGVPFTPDNFAYFIKRGNTDMCEHFLKAGMSPNSRDVNGTPLLNIACREGKTEMVRWLLDHKASIDPVSQDRGYTPLMDSVWKGNLDAAKMLVAAGADVNIISKEGQSMLVLAVGAGNVPLCRLLADNGADVDAADAMGMSALGYATLFKKDEIVKILSPHHKE